ncbi:MAG: hypothetical protein MJ186_00475 [Clostridia bacterium]|nr:hypothetical protein [Clostridia bacterium]
MIPQFLLNRIREYLDRNLIEQPAAPLPFETFGAGLFKAAKSAEAPEPCESAIEICECTETLPQERREKDEMPAPAMGFKRLSDEDIPVRRDLEEMLRSIDESFSQMLLRLIDERGWKDSYCYKKANLTRAHFNRIKNDPDYRIGKPSACALALALELNSREAELFLKKAGFYLSNASKSDLIIRYCINHKIYDVNTVNEILYEFDQALLGAK